LHEHDAASGFDLGDDSRRAWRAGGVDDLEVGYTQEGDFDVGDDVGPDDADMR
jgi:hypothetical protein